MTEAAIAAKAAAQALRMAQAAANPLVAIKHGRREDRAVVYDRFLTLCISFYRLRRDGESDIPQRVDDFYATLHAIELRAPGNVRRAARHLFWRIVGTPMMRDSLYKHWYAEDIDEDTLEAIDDSHVMGHRPSDKVASPVLWNDLEEHEKLAFLRSWYKPWTWRKSVKELESRRPHRHPFWRLNTFRHSAEFLDGIAYFTWVARIDVNNRWRWWHWPMALIPPLKRWQLER
ncbi:hypothetical protein [Streptomyces umbrinus]|uniref:hypothetical protein n=1 Tax=Streptomyces umbrinus TaxID=67370 RepID=UPI0033D0668F